MLFINIFITIVFGGFSSSDVTLHWFLQGYNNFLFPQREVMVMYKFIISYGDGLSLELLTFNHSGSFTRSSDGFHVNYNIENIEQKSAVWLGPYMQSVVSREQ